MIGLTGGIGSGKSVVAARLAHHGAVVIDADRLAREVVEPGTDGLREVVATFGARVCRPDGSLDRTALGDIVFGDATARSRLEQIIHPRVRARRGQLVAAAAPDAIVVDDVPLLVEVGTAPTYHLVVVVRATEQTRVERLVRNRGMTEAQARQRIRAQVDDARRAAIADVLLDNDGDLTSLYAAVDTLWRERLRPYELNVRQRRAVRPADVRLVESDPDWPARYARLAARIRHVLGPEEFRVDHVGSTAVPGLPARDVIDVLVGVRAMTEAASISAGRTAITRPKWTWPAHRPASWNRASPARNTWIRTASARPRASQTYRLYIVQSSPLRKSGYEITASHSVIRKCRDPVQMLCCLHGELPKRPRAGYNPGKRRSFGSDAESWG